MAAAPAAIPQFLNYDDIEPYIRRHVRKWFYQGPFLTALREGRLNRPQLRYFALQYGHYSRHFPRVLGAAISAMEAMEDWWIPLADNLWDEAGRGVPNRSHGALYQTFLSSVDPEAVLAATTWGRAVQKAVTYFVRFFQNASPIDAMAAVGLGSELFASDVMGWILEGLRHPRYQHPRRLDLKFWETHVLRDEPRHYALCRKALLPRIGPEHLPRLVAVGLDIARSEALMYTEILEEFPCRTIPSP